MSIRPPDHPADDLASLSDGALVARCQAEVPDGLEAYGELVRRFEPMIGQVCLRLLGDRSEAEEAAQDVLLTVFHKIGQFEHRAAFSTWLYKIVQNECRRRIQKLIRRRELAEAVRLESNHHPSPHSNDHRDNERAELIRMAMARLGEEDREVIVLRYFAGLSLQEAADVLDLGLSAAKMRLYRAMEEFKAAVERCESPRVAPIPPKP
jgi:RNA polymerase sigma-70 factor (ECF subfamily)